jgi:hypothetical protein
MALLRHLAERNTSGKGDSSITLDTLLQWVTRHGFRSLEAG